MTTSQSSTEAKKPKYDIFRDSPLRYLGYANEVGESFRYQYPRFVIPTYIISFGYCLADAATSGHEKYQATESATESTLATMDVLLWQSLASVAIPGFCINMIVKAARLGVARSPALLPVAVATWGPTFVGLGSIPLIIHPIDVGVDSLMDATYRPFAKSWMASDKEKET